MTGFNTTADLEQITEDDIKFYDSKEQNAKVTSMNAVSVVISVIIVGFSLAALVCTFIMWSQAKKLEEKMEQRSQQSRRGRSEDPQIVSRGDGNDDRPQRRLNRSSITSSFASL